MSVVVLLFLFCLGGVVGVVAGLMGIGGGMIMVPFLITAFTFDGYPEASLVKMAIGTSLASIIFTSISSVLSHHRQGSVIWPVVQIMAPGIALGALSGSQLVGMAPAVLVSIIFGLFLIWSAWSVGFRKPSRDSLAETPRPKRSVLATSGFGIGLASSVVGAGGGFITIPFLIRQGMVPTRAVGCSAACGLPIAIAGTIGYMLAETQVDLPGAVIGYVHIPALLAIASASVLTAPYGARLAHRLPPARLRKILAGLLAALAAYMLGRLLFV